MRRRNGHHAAEAEGAPSSSSAVSAVVAEPSSDAPPGPGVNLMNNNPSKSQLKSTIQSEMQTQLIRLDAIINTRLSQIDALNTKTTNMQMSNMKNVHPRLELVESLENKCKRLERSLEELDGKGKNKGGYLQRVVMVVVVLVWIVIWCRLSNV